MMLLKKALFLAYRDLSKKWSMPVRNWSVVIGHFAICFADQLKEHL